MRDRPISVNPITPIRTIELLLAEPSPYRAHLSHFLGRYWRISIIGATDYQIRVVLSREGFKITDEPDALRPVTFMCGIM